MDRSVRRIREGKEWNEEGREPFWGLRGIHWSAVYQVVKMSWTEDNRVFVSVVILRLFCPVTFLEVKTRPRMNKLDGHSRARVSGEVE